MTKVITEIYKRKYEETREGLLDHYHPSKMKDEHREAISAYTHESGPINEPMWNNKPHEHDDQYVAEHLQEALQAHKTPHGLLVYSGVKTPPSKLTGPNHDGGGHYKVHLPAFTSTSLSLSVAAGFSGYHYPQFLEHSTGKLKSHEEFKQEFPHKEDHFSSADLISAAHRAHNFYHDRERIRAEAIDTAQQHEAYAKDVAASIKKPLTAWPSDHKKSLELVSNPHSTYDEVSSHLDKIAKKHGHDSEYGRQLFRIFDSVQTAKEARQRAVREHPEEIEHFPMLKDEQTRKALVGHSAINKHVVRIHVPEGSHGLFVDHMSENPGEDEFILPPNSRLHIDKKPRVSKKHRAFVWKAKLVHDGTKNTGLK